MVWVTGGTLAGTAGSPEEEDPSSAETRGSRAEPPPARGRRGGWETRRHAAINIRENMLKIFGVEEIFTAREFVLELTPGRGSEAPR